MILDYPGGLAVITGSLKVQKETEGRLEGYDSLKNSDWLPSCLHKIKHTDGTHLVVWFLPVTFGSAPVVRGTNEEGMDGGESAASTRRKGP